MVNNDGAASLDDLYGALSDGSRRSMVAALASRRLRVKDFAAVFPFSVNATSKHLKVLERAGLIERQVKGREHFFALRPDALFAARDWIDHYEDFWDEHLAALDVRQEPQAYSRNTSGHERPPFPDTPGSWLAQFRYRSKTASEAHMSLSSMASQMGVPDLTVERWENDGLVPSEGDLSRISEVCSLNGFESEFLTTAFRGQPEMAAPDESAFRSWAAKALAVDYPCIVFDSMYFVRAWNEGFAELFPTARMMTTPWHAVELYRRIYDQGNRLVDQRLLVQCLREIWWRTAAYCGTPLYKSLLARFRSIPDFESAWVRFSRGVDRQPIGMPYPVSDKVQGSYEFYTMPVSLPPTYYFRGYVALDDTAKSVVEAMSSREVYIAPSVHWAEDAQSLT